MSDGMRRELVYLSSHATNHYFIPNWGMNVGFQEGFRKIRGFLIGRSYFHTLYLINK